MNTPMNTYVKWKFFLFENGPQLGDIPVGAWAEWHRYIFVPDRGRWYIVYPP